jgi:hypothetical protein
MRLRNVSRKGRASWPPPAAGAAGVRETVPTELDIVTAGV